MIDAALILAGGRGSRLSPWSAPKCLLPIRGVPMLARLLRQVAPSVCRAVVCTGYRTLDVEAAIGSLKLPLPVTVSSAGEDASMGRRLLCAHDDLKLVSRALVLYGDEIADVDVAALEREHDAARGPLATFTACDQILPFGVVGGPGEIAIRGDVLVRVNIGFALVEPGAWSYLHAGDGLADWLNRIPRRAVHVYLHRGRRATVNSPADVALAEEVFA